MMRSRASLMQVLDASSLPSPVHFCWTRNPKRFLTDGLGHSSSRFDVRGLPSRCRGDSLRRLLPLSESARSILHPFLGANDGLGTCSIATHRRISGCAPSSHLTNRHRLGITIHCDHRRYGNARHRGIVEPIQPLSATSPLIDVSVLQSERTFQRVSSW